MIRNAWIGDHGHVIVGYVHPITARELRSRSARLGEREELIASGTEQARANVFQEDSGPSVTVKVFVAASKAQVPKVVAEADGATARTRPAMQMATRANFLRETARIRYTFL